MAKIKVTCQLCYADIELGHSEVSLLLPYEGMGEEHVQYAFTCSACDKIVVRNLPEPEEKIFKVMQRAGVRVISAPLEVTERPIGVPPINSDDLLEFCIEMQNSSGCLAEEFF